MFIHHFRRALAFVRRTGFDWPGLAVGTFTGAASGTFLVYRHFAQQQLEKKNDNHQTWDKLSRDRTMDEKFDALIGEIIQKEPKS